MLDIVLLYILAKIGISGLFPLLKQMVVVKFVVWAKLYFYKKRKHVNILTGKIKEE